MSKSFGCNLWALALRALLIQRPWCFEEKKGSNPERRPWHCDFIFLQEAFVLLLCPRNVQDVYYWFLWCLSRVYKPYLNWRRPRVESKLLKLPHLLWYTPLAGGGANWQWAVDSTLTVLWRFLWGQPLAPRQAMTAKRWANVFAGGLFSYCLCGRNCHCEGGHLTAFFVCVEWCCFIRHECR